MFGYEKIDLSLTFNSFFFFAGITLLLLYTFYIYRFTLPPVSKIKRYFLIFLRSLALILLLFIFFEPVLTFTKKNILTPVNLFFFDNSKSIKITDKTNRAEVIKKLIEQTSNENLNGNKEYFSFGTTTNELKADSLNVLNFLESNTDFSDIFRQISQTEQNVSAITIISDGVITKGSTPLYSAEKTGIPVFTIGIGDSTRKNDVEIKSVIHNDFIYNETPTTIMATILNKGFAGKSSVISLFEGNQLIEQKNFILETSGVNSVSFNYTPKQSGEKKLTLKLNAQKDEATLANNQRVNYINVLSNKINVLLIAGAPSADLTFIKNSLVNDPNLKVNTLTQISAGNFLEQNAQSKLDSADIVYLISFPTNLTSDDFLDKLKNKLDNRNTPVFILLSGDIDVNKLAKFENILPVSVQSLDKNYLQVQPDLQVSELTNPLTQNNSVKEWNDLPPVSQPFASVTVKPESKIIAKVRINNQPRNNPLIVSRNFGSKRSVAVIGKDIWKWKLQTATKNLTLFDNFIVSSVRWLNAPEDQKKVKIKTSKKVYSSGEIVEFSAQVYDESFNPVNDAEVKVKVSNQNFNQEFNLNSIGNGLYDGSISLSSNGDYVFNGSALLNNKSLGSDNGSFNIGDIDIEMVDTRMNYEFLNALSNQTKGKYFDPDEYDKLLDELKNINLNSSKEKFTTSEVRLWSDELLLMLVILLFAAEWFTRKRAGML